MINASATKFGFKKWQLAVAALVAAMLALGAYFLANRPQTPFEQAVSLIRAGKAAAALPILEQLSHQHPDDPQVFPWLAQGYLSTERLGEGRTALDTALRCKLPAKTLCPVVLSYAVYYESRNDFEEGKKLFDSARLACRGRDILRGQAELFFKWAESDAGQGQLMSAIQHLEAGNELLSDSREPVKNEIVHRLCDYYRQLAAVAETKEKDDNKAASILKKSLRLAEEPATYMALADIFTRQGKLDEAIESYQKVCQVDENNLEARHRLIDLLVQKQNYAVAQQALMELTDKEKSLENYRLLASLNLKMGNYGGAVHALEDAINLKANDPDLLSELENVLRNWSAVLASAGKIDESLSVKGHADRIKEMLDLLKPKQKPEEKNLASNGRPPWDPSNPPIALSSSRIWLARGSLTPEGEIQIKNITGRPVDDLALTVVFFDHTIKSRTGTVVLPVAGPTSAPFDADASRSLYFSCPNIVHADHQLAVIIYWKGHFLKELPVVKMNL